MKNKLKNFYNDYSKQLEASEKAVLPNVYNLYREEYNKINQQLLTKGTIIPSIYFKVDMVRKMYEKIYLYAGFRISNWYVKNYLKLYTKSEQYQQEWNLLYTSYAQQMATYFAVEINNAATQHAIRVFNGLMADPAFASLPLEAKARILVEKTKDQAMIWGRRIVATETNRIANYSIEKTSLQFFPKDSLKKFWIAGGMNIRDTHLAAMGRYGPATEGIPMSEPFLVGEDIMQRPCAGSLAKENVNCKCVMATLPLDNAQSIGEDVTGFDFGLSAGYEETSYYE